MFAFVDFQSTVEGRKMEDFFLPTSVAPFIVPRDMPASKSNSGMYSIEGTFVIIGAGLPGTLSALLAKSAGEKISSSGVSLYNSSLPVTQIVLFK
jgi:hypothetical protein